MPQLSIEFLLFVSGLVLLFWRIPESWRPIALLAGSSVFLLALDWVSFLLLTALASAVYWGGGAFLGRIRRGWSFGLALLIGVFSSVRLGALLGDLEGVPRIVVPLGFSFYLLKLVHAWVDFRDRGPLHRGTFLSFLNYALFFPTLMVGPIHRYEDFLCDERRRRWDANLFASGLERILYGYGKVVVIANWAVASLLHGAFVSVATPGTPGWVLQECVVYGFYLYFAFAGFSDVAIGIARLFGQTVGENFHYPYFQKSITDFWKSWHMSLSAWCRQYVFTPVLMRWRRPTLAVLASMLILGLWHEFTLRYVVWGLYHGAGLALHRVYRTRTEVFRSQERPQWVKTLGSGLGIATTFSFVMVGFVITKNSTFAGIVEDVRILLLGSNHG